MQERPLELSFAGHQTFAFRSAWPKKAVDATEKNPQIFASQDAMVRLGVGKNMVASIRHWGLALGILEEDPGVKNGRGRFIRPTELGRALLDDDGWDPFLEDPGTLWLFHWQLASQPSHATTWWYAFNRHRSLEFSRPDLLRQIQEFASTNNVQRVSPASLKRDVDCFTLTYSRSRRRQTHDDEAIDCPLVDLGLIEEVESHERYHLMRRSHRTLPHAVFAFALVSYIQSRPHRSATLAFEELSSHPGSPGRVFCLDESGLIGHLEALSQTTNGALSYDETSGLRQVFVKKEMKPLALLKKHYGMRSPSHEVTGRSRQN